MIIYLHIPHTCGRSIKRSFFIKDELKNIVWIHNSSQITQMKRNNDEILYFVLRNPIERVIGEFKHYSRNLKSIGIVNHLDLNNILEKNPTFNMESILDYCSLEVNRNVCCKFLLLRKDFNIPITENDYSAILNSNFKFDVYSFPLKLPVLSSLLGFEISPHIVVNNVDKNDISKNKIEMIKKLNEYDLCLYNYLNKCDLII